VFTNLIPTASRCLFLIDLWTEIPIYSFLICFLIVFYYTLLLLPHHLIVEEECWFIVVRVVAPIAMGTHDPDLEYNLHVGIRTCTLVVSSLTVTEGRSDFISLHVHIIPLIMSYRSMPPKVFTGGVPRVRTSLLSRNLKSSAMNIHICNDLDLQTCMSIPYFDIPSMWPR
jgi:hypothetical protein